MCLGSAVAKKIENLVGIDQEIILVSCMLSDVFYLSITIFFQKISLLISLVTDRWSAMHHHQYSSFSIQNMDEPSDTLKLWVLKSHLIDFKHSNRHHTGVRVGEELIKVITKFGLQKKVSLQAILLLAQTDVCSWAG